VPNITDKKRKLIIAIFNPSKRKILLPDINLSLLCLWSFLKNNRPYFRVILKHFSRNKTSNKAFFTVWFVPVSAGAVRCLCRVKRQEMLYFEIGLE
jgi:hypothetical protein